MPCNNCLADHGLSFDRAYEPHQAIEGHRNARILVIGLNPKQIDGREDGREIEDLVRYFDNQAEVHSYFKNFNIVSEILYNSFGQPYGAAHMDLVKCSSPNWKNNKNIISHCAVHLQRQLTDEVSPEIIICNGSAVCSAIKIIYPPPQGTSNQATKYIHKIGTRRIHIVLSGFIGRIDNYSKKRLGVEIEEVIATLPDPE